jgi:formate-dependent nitrite reductase cytochrome c552 subunit
MTCTACHTPATILKSGVAFMNREIIRPGERLCKQCVEQRKELVKNDATFRKTLPLAIVINDTDDLQTHSYGFSSGTGTLRKLPLKTSLKFFANK